MSDAAARSTDCDAPWLDRFMTHWFGYAVPPAAQAISRASYVPDAADAYCHRCGDSVGRGEATTTGCASCRDAAALADDVIRLGPYAEPLRDWVLAVKYERWAAMGEALGQRLGRALLEADAVDPSRAVIVPMPMPWQRRIYRGIDHARVIAAATARQLRAPLAAMLCRRHGPPQVTLSPSDRQRLGGRDLRWRRRFRKASLDGLHIVLVDDIRTTGTTMRRAVRLVRQAAVPPQRVVAAFLAVADPASRRMRNPMPTATDI